MTFVETTDLKKLDQRLTDSSLDAITLLQLIQDYFPYYFDKINEVSIPSSDEPKTYPILVIDNNRNLYGNMCLFITYLLQTSDLDKLDNQKIYLVRSTPDQLLWSLTKPDIKDYKFSSIDPSYLMLTFNLLLKQTLSDLIFNELKARRSIFVNN